MDARKAKERCEPPLGVNRIGMVYSMTDEQLKALERLREWLGSPNMYKWVDRNYATADCKRDIRAILAWALTHG